MTLLNNLLNHLNLDFRNITPNITFPQFSKRSCYMKLNLFRFAPVAARDWTKASSSTLKDILAGVLSSARGCLSLLVRDYIPRFAFSASRGYRVVSAVRCVLFTQAYFMVHLMSYFDFFNECVSVLYDLLLYI